MFGHATLMVHRGAQLVSRDALRGIEPPPATATWKPINHAHLINLIHEELAFREIEIAQEEYAIQRDGQRLFGAMVLNWLTTDAFAAALAFRHANDRKLAMKMYAGVHTFVGDNMALSGDEIILHKRHLPHLNIRHALMQAFERHQQGALVLRHTIEALQCEPLTREAAERPLFQIFWRKILPVRLFAPVADAYSSGERQTSWALLSACTAVTQQLPPGPNLTATVRLGTFFGLNRTSPREMLTSARQLVDQDEKPRAVAVDRAPA
jgi:hypothetical protein